MVEWPVDLPCPHLDWQPQEPCGSASGTEEALVEIQGMLERQGASHRWALPGPRPSHPAFLFATDPVLQPLGRHLMEQGRGGPVLLALAGSEHGPANWRREEWRPEEDQPAEASTCLPRCPEPPPGKDPASRCLAHLSALQSSGFPGLPGSSGHHPPHPPSHLCVSLM